MQVVINIARGEGGESTTAPVNKSILVTQQQFIHTGCVSSTVTN